jgi:hypothetical protein
VSRNQDAADGGFIAGTDLDTDHDTAAIEFRLVLGGVVLGNADSGEHSNDAAGQAACARTRQHCGDGSGDEGHGETPGRDDRAGRGHTRNDCAKRTAEAGSDSDVCRHVRVVSFGGYGPIAEVAFARALVHDDADVAMGVAEVFERVDGSLGLDAVREETADKL